MENARRGHETQRHIEAKLAIGQMFKNEDWSVFFEQCNADILVLHHATRFVASIEAEASPRNVLRNIERNIKYGCKAVATVSLTDRYLGQITTKVFKYSDQNPEFPIRLFRHNKQGLEELHSWIVSLAEHTASARKTNHDPE
ncbi:hypothetical protein PDESU_04793 [Pontiella desulfatans]|uniref:Uncharacterized protein n=1 Tax=Pontiella desulfatans TaxID=2750659 RepID=A0A6C2U7W8_PONDE|nr:hypothetical protein [Pontiella desulfatans]VGO16202.1 hypothetical protein PDESU_04793 [Pontiella desulfatans]